MKLLAFASVCALALPAAANADVIYSSDFEADDGGWTADATWDTVGDWEWGEYDFGLYTGGYNPPPAAYSGTHLWGTVLHGDYTNSGGESFLRQTFDFSGYLDVEMKFANWAEVFYSFDTAILYANGAVVYERTVSDPPAAWEIISLDLSAYDGMSSVEFVFELHASTVVERAGWYIDDLTITGIPAPGTAVLLGLAGLALRRRR